ncbi:MAG: hypothetical protein K2W94_09245 [Alphaproteobacteria bacterium]|nr:hypothetical protein [Alphaproteobacteria bacterium]
MKRKAFKEVVDFVLDFSKGSREFDERELAKVNGKPNGYRKYGSKVVHILKSLTELEEKRPSLLNVEDQFAHWIFDPKEFLRRNKELRLDPCEVTWDYRITFRRAELHSGSRGYREFQKYLKATLMYETLYIKKKGTEHWGARFPNGNIYANTLPLWYQPEDWLREQEGLLRIP